MLRKLIALSTNDAGITHAEGELYKIINLHGRVFEIRYGYYEECDRQNPIVKPMPIYPDLIKEPIFTNDGFRFVTKMQDACRYYKGKEVIDKGCAECEHYRHGAELIGVCSHIENKNDNCQGGHNK